MKRFFGFFVVESRKNRRIEVVEKKHFMSASVTNLMVQTKCKLNKLFPKLFYIQCKEIESKRYHENTREVEKWKNIDVRKVKEDS